MRGTGMPRSADSAACPVHDLGGSDEEPVLAGEPGEIVIGLGVEFEPSCLLVERGQRLGVGAVECDRRSFIFKGTGSSVVGMHWLLPKLRCRACGKVTCADRRMGGPGR